MRCHAAFWALDIAAPFGPQFKRVVLVPTPDA